MGLYAEGTSVTPDRSQQEITATLRRYGAQSVAIAFEPARAMVAFVAHDRQVRIAVDLPTDPGEFRRTATGKHRDQVGARVALDAEVRRRWRALAMVIKAKLEIVATGIGDFETEFLAHLVLPDGATVAEHALPAVRQAYETGVVPPLLPPTRKAIEAGEGQQS